MYKTSIAEIKEITKDFDEIFLEKCRVFTLLNMCNKLIGLENADIELRLRNQINALEKMPFKDVKQFRQYRKDLEILKSAITQEFGYYEKGSIIEKYTGLGLVFGVAIGTAFMSFMAASIGLGLALGIAIGAGIGSEKEKDELEKGNLY